MLNILAFGIAREIMQGGVIKADAELHTAGELRIWLEENYPKLKSLRSFMIAINNEYASADAKINAGDEIAVIPPVSGG
jgi:molybdopterin synthase sulfur carrier subunit